MALLAILYLAADPYHKGMKMVYSGFYAIFVGLSNYL